MESKDLELISGRFLEMEIPKEKKFLLKYFTGKVQVAFLRFYLVFGTIRNFTNHTGFHCSHTLLKRFRKRYLDITFLYEKSKKEITEESLRVLNLIESGKLNLAKLKKGEIK
jgi:hypothetical protein